MLSLYNAEEMNLEHLYQKSRSHTYVSIDEKRFKAATDCFEKVFLSNTAKNTCLDTLGLKQTMFDSRTAVITGKESKGEGFYVIHYGDTFHHLVSLPHSFYDSKTGSIGRKLMSEEKFRAAAFNNVHRNLMDSAHTEHTFFSAFHVAFANLFQYETIYQLHGFNPEKRKDTRAKFTDAIVSSGNRYFTDRSSVLCQCIQRYDTDCHIFGVNVFELGGTKNSQLNMLQDIGYYNFIHMEMSYNLRSRIDENTTIRTQIGGCLLK